jgi:hypothetical protein
MGTDLLMKLSKPLVVVSVYLKGDKLRPERVSEIIGVEPQDSQTKGGYQSRSKRFTAKIGMWRTSVKSDQRRVEIMIDELLQSLGRPPVPLNKIEGVQHAELDILIASGNGPNETVGFTLTQEHLARLIQLGLSVCYTVS